MDFPNVKIYPNISGFFLTVNTGLFFLRVASSLGFFQSNTVILSSSALVNISIKWMIVGAMIHYIVSTYLENKYNETEDENILYGYAVLWIIILFAYYLTFPKIGN